MYQERDQHQQRKASLNVNGIQDGIQLSRAHKDNGQHANQTHKWIE
jgi:hypothetical protein